MAIHTEKAFEDLIEEFLLEKGGWSKSAAEHFIPAKGVDLFELWARGKYFPVAYSRAKVESVAEKTTTLAPAGTVSSGRK